MPKYYESWTDEDIREYLDRHHILVLFKMLGSNKSANMVLHGDISASQKVELEKQISIIFGGSLLTSSTCEKINEYANKWYKKNVLTSASRVINFKRKDQ